MIYLIKTKTQQIPQESFLRKLRNRKNGSCGNCGNSNLPAQAGYAILELLFYISFFALFSLVVIDAMITMTKSFKENTIQAELMQSGTIMERMSREIRQAYDINSISLNDLTLKTKDNNGTDKTVEFLLTGSDIRFLENGIFTGNLNAPNIVVTGLSFTQINTVKSKAIKMVLSIRSENDTSNKVVDFYDTIVLRGSY